MPPAGYANKASDQEKVPADWGAAFPGLVSYQRFVEYTADFIHKTWTVMASGKLA